jgi:hypothetical protein
MGQGDLGPGGEHRIVAMLPNVAGLQDHALRLGKGTQILDQGLIRRAESGLIHSIALPVNHGGGDTLSVYVEPYEHRCLHAVPP